MERVEIEERFRKKGAENIVKKKNKDTKEWK